jgi:hypothetical protein
LAGSFFALVGDPLDSVVGGALVAFDADIVAEDDGVLGAGVPGADVPGADVQAAPSASTVSSVAVRRITDRHPSSARKFSPNLSIKSHHD